MSLSEYHIGNKAILFTSAFVRPAEFKLEEPRYWGGRHCGPTGLTDAACGHHSIDKIKSEEDRSRSQQDNRVELQGVQASYNNGLS